MIKQTFWTVTIAGSLALGVWVGCGDTSPPTVETPSRVAPDVGVTILEESQPSEQQVAAMMAAKDALFAALSARLQEAMGQGGPGSAIAVCQREAQEIAARVGETHALKIGRTGVRLRNLRNQAPYWAKDWIEDQVAEPRFAILSNQHAAALLPIKLQTQCLMCHGPTDQMLPEIKSQLVDRYPKDQAVNFAEGELRGWFWIEMPIAE
jgi:hypothetical protein